MTEKKKVALSIIILLLTAFCVIPGFSVPGNQAFAAEQAADVFGEDTGMVLDKADLLTDDEEEKLEQQCGEILGQYGISVPIITTSDIITGDIKEWVRSQYEAYNIQSTGGSGSLMLAVSMGSRTWGIVGFGTAQDVFNTYSRERIGSAVAEKLSDGNYYKAFAKYLSMTEEFLEAAEEGKPYSEANEYKESVNIFLIIGISFAVSFVISLIILLVWKSGMNTRVRQTAAGAYLVEDSFRLTGSSDLFLYRQVNRTRRNRDNGHHGGGGGGGMHSDHSGTSGRF